MLKSRGNCLLTCAFGLSDDIYVPLGCSTRGWPSIYQWSVPMGRLPFSKAEEVDAVCDDPKLLRMIRVGYPAPFCQSLQWGYDHLPKIVDRSFVPVVDN